MDFDISWFCIPVLIWKCYTLESNGDDMDLYINGYFDTSDKILTADKFCTDILASGNCEDIVKSYDGTIWNFFWDMSVDFQTTHKCIRMTKDYAIFSTGCTEPIHGVVCRLDCCKFWYFYSLELELIIYVF